MNIGDNIKALRAMRGIKQKDLADALGFSCQNISKWENGVSLPDIDTVLALSGYFGVSTDVLLGNVPKTAKETIDVAVNSLKSVTVWTDFEHMNSIAPPAHHEGRRRGGVGRRTRAHSAQNCLLMGVDAEHKICMLHVILGNIFVNAGWFYQRPGGNNCVIKNEDAAEKWYKSGHWELVVPKDGFLLAAELCDYRVTRLLRFVIPEEYHSYLDKSSPMYNNFRNVYNGKQLFSDILGRGELDFIDVTLEQDKLVLTKPLAFVDPLAENIDRLTGLVKERVEQSLKEIRDELATMHMQVEEAQSLAEEAMSTAEDAMSTAEDARCIAEDNE